MKTINNKISLFSLSALFLSLFLGSCSDEYEAPDTLSDASWYTTQTMKNGNLNRYVVAAGKSITFMDVSQGAVTHEWKIKSPDVFLNDVVDLKDTLENQINTKLGETNEAKVATVLFRSAGMDSVVLHNIFEDSVTFHGKNGDIASVKENGEWVLNKVFYVDVFGELAPAFDVLDADSTLLYSFSSEQLKNTMDVADYDSINIEAGNSLIFVDKSEAGRPNNRIWNTPSGTPVSGNKEKYAVSFYLPGSYSNLKMTSSRNGNDSVPAGKVTVNIPLTINVIASTSAYTIIDKNTSDADNNKVTQIADNQLKFTTGGVVDGASLVSCAGDFLLHVKNTNVTPNIDKDIAISSVQALPTDIKSVVLTIDEPIYENDEVSLSYNGLSFKAADGRSLSKFTNEGITLLKGENVMLDLDGNSYGSFENEQTNNVAWCWWTPNTTKVNFVRSDEQAAAGDYSCLISGQAGVTTGNPTVLTSKIDGNFYFNYPASTYSLSMKVYVDPNVSNTGAKIHTLCKVNGQSLTWDLSSVKKGEWVTLPAKQMVFTKDEQQFKIQLQSADIVDKYRFFIDDIQLVSSNSRPNE